MKLELFVVGATAFILYNMYNENKLIKVIMSYKKYYQMAFIVFLALCFYLMVKRKPDQAKNLLLYTNNMIKYMPIDKSAIDMITPIFDFTLKGQKSFMEDMNPSDGYNPTLSGMPTRTQFGGAQKATKRSVSETKKKYVASMQDWKCNECRNKLTHTFEIDHKIRLESGGGNEVTNLVALCRECHGQKTAMENM